MEGIVNDDILKMDNISRRRRNRWKSNEEDKITRPFLLRRFLAGFVDMVIIIATFALLYVGCYYTIFKSIGYEEAIQNVYQMNEDSHLYNKVYVTSENVSYFDLEENFDEAITYYYSNDSRAIADNKLAEYSKAKIDSGLDFTIDNDETKAFYKNQYEIATTYFKANPDYVYYVNKTYVLLTSIVILLIETVLTIFYLVIPLCRKEGETIGQMLFKICLIDSRDLSQVKKWQIALRYMVLVVINYAITIVIYLIWDYATLLPALITLFMMSFTKKNKGPHDYLSQSHIILKHRADAMDAYKVIKEQSQNQY